MYLIALAGATASGKTSMAIHLAQHFGAEIISCDARQFYREMSIGTAKPTEEELAAVPHHFVNNRSISENYTVQDYEKEVLDFLASYYQHKRVAILVGGSGLFYRAVCEGGLDPMPDVAPEIRAHWNQRLEAEGLAAIQAELQAADPDYFAQVDVQNPRRLLRALEIISQTGQPFSKFHSRRPAERPFKVIKIGLDWPREQLYARINQRVDAMFAQGLEAEARTLYPQRSLNALQTVGYSEIYDFIEGRLPSLAEAKEKIKQHSRNYAKRQETWFRKEANIKWFAPPHQPEALIQYLESQIL